MEIQCGTQSPSRGAVERIVWILKPILIKMIGKMTLTVKDFVVVLAKAERCINCRPYCSISSSSNDPLPLTPQHFIIGDLSMQLPNLLMRPEDVISVAKKEEIIDSWNKRQALYQKFWEEWQQQYVAALISRDKWNRETRAMGVGELVLVHTPRQKQHMYPMGVVIECIKSPNDGLVRHYRVRMPDGKVLHRDMNYISRLEVDQIVDIRDVDSKPVLIDRSRSASKEEVPVKETTGTVLRSGRVSKKPVRLGL